MVVFKSFHERGFSADDKHIVKLVTPVFVIVNGPILPDVKSALVPTFPKYWIPKQVFTTWLVSLSLIPA